MKLSPRGLALLTKSESCRLKAYKCPAGVWTIGWGHCGPEVHEGMEVTNEEASTLLQADVLAFDAGVSAICPESTQSQHDAMCCLAFNIGIEAFRKSSVARLHNAGKYAEAGQAFALWNRAGGKVLPGLVARRAAEASLYLSDVPQEQAANADGEKSLVHSRTINGGTLATAGTTLTIISQVMPEGTLDTIKDALGGIPGTWAAYAVLGLTLLGVGLSIYARWSDRNEGRA